MNTKITLDSLYAICKQGHKPARYFKTRAYIGINSRHKDSFGAWEDCLCAVAWRGDSTNDPRMFAVDFDAVWEFNSTDWERVCVAIQAEATQKGRRLHQEGDRLLYRESITHYPIYSQTPVTESLEVN